MILLQALWFLLFVLFFSVAHLKQERVHQRYIQRTTRSVLDDLWEMHILNTFLDDLGNDGKCISDVSFTCNDAFLELIKG